MRLRALSRLCLAHIYITHFPVLSAPALLPVRFAHEGILNCARAIRDDLDRLGLLDQLLLGSHLTTDATISKQQPNGHIPGSRADTADSDIAACCVSAAAAALADGSEAGLGGVGGAAGAEAAKGGVAGAEEGRFMSSSELPDCRGWTLVLTGHSLGELHVPVSTDTVPLHVSTTILAYLLVRGFAYVLVRGASWCCITVDLCVWIWMQKPAWLSLSARGSWCCLSRSALCMCL